MDVLKATAATSQCEVEAKARLAALAAALAAASGETTTALEELARHSDKRFKEEAGPSAMLTLATEAAALSLTRGEAQAVLLLCLSTDHPERAVRALLLERERRRRPFAAPAVALVLVLVTPALPPGWSQDGELEEALRRGSAAEIMEAARGLLRECGAAASQSDDELEAATKELERTEAQLAKARRAVAEASSKRARRTEARCRAFEDIVKGAALDEFMVALFAGAASAAEVAAELPKLRAFVERLDEDEHFQTAMAYVNSLRRRLKSFSEQAHELLNDKRSVLQSAKNAVLVERGTAEAALRAVNEFAASRGLPGIKEDVKECTTERLAQLLFEAPSILQKAMETRR